MRNVLPLVAIAGWVACSAPDNHMPTQHPLPPKAEKIDHVVLLHGDTRNDDYFWVRPSLNYEFNERVNAGVFYQFRTKNSDAAGGAYDYSNNQLGIFTNYRF